MALSWIKDCSSEWKLNVQAFNEGRVLPKVQNGAFDCDRGVDVMAGGTRKVEESEQLADLSL